MLNQQQVLLGLSVLCFLQVCDTFFHHGLVMVPKTHARVGLCTGTVCTKRFVTASPAMSSDLESFTVKELRDKLIALGGSPSTKLRKSELIDMLQTSSTPPTAAELASADDSQELAPEQIDRDLNTNGGEQSSPAKSDEAAAQFFEEEETKATVPEGFFEDDSLSTRDVHTMTVPELKDQLRSHGLKVGGVKAELQERLLDFLNNGPTVQSMSPAGQSRSTQQHQRRGPSMARPAREQRKPATEREWGDNRKVFVSGLPFRSRPQELVQLAEERYGAVERVEGMFVFGRASGRAWVTFEDQAAAKMAVSDTSDVSIGERFVRFSPPWARQSRQALREMTANLPDVDRETEGYGYEDRASSPARQRSAGRERATDFGDAPPMRERRAGSREQTRGPETMLRESGSETLSRRSESPARPRFEERKTVFVGRIPREAEKSDVREAMETMGRVASVRMGLREGEFQGFAHVEFADADAASLAISSPVEILGSAVKLNLAAEGKRDDREQSFPLPEHLHGMLIGVRGRRVRELEELSGARIGFTLTPQPSMVVRGSPAQRRTAWQAAQRHLANAGTDSLPIPKEKWSVVIGARGARIRGLEEQTGAKLQLDEDPTPGLRIFGLPGERRAAAQLVAEILEGEEEELFAVPAKYHGLLVGKRGMTVKELQRESGAFISLVKLPEPAMLIKGTNRQRDKAWGITQKLLDELPGVLAEIRTMQGGGAARQGDFADVDDIEAEDGIYLDGDAQDAEAEGTEVLWEEAVARAVEKAKAAYNEERLEMRRAERGV